MCVTNWVTFIPAVFCVKVKRSKRKPNRDNKWSHYFRIVAASPSQTLGLPKFSINLCERITEFFRSDPTPTRAPQKPSQGPKAPVFQNQTPNLHCVSCTIHIPLSLYLVLFCSRIDFILNKLCWDFVSNALQRDIMCVRMCADLNAGVCPRVRTL